MSKPKPATHDDCSWIIEWLFDEYVKTFRYDKTSTSNVLKHDLCQVVAARNLSQGRRRCDDTDRDTVELAETLKELGVIIDENKHFWYVNVERVRELFCAESDGPIAGGFRWNGKEHYGLIDKPNSLVRVLWNSENRVAGFDDCAGPVWGDHNADVTYESLASLRTRVNKFFKKHGIPFRVEVSKKVGEVSLLPDGTQKTLEKSQNK